jgi:hypothetical protein
VTGERKLHSYTGHTVEPYLIGAIVNTLATEHAIPEVNQALPELGPQTQLLQQGRLQENRKEQEDSEKQAKQKRREEGRTLATETHKQSTVAPMLSEHAASGFSTCI